MNFFCFFRKITILLCLLALPIIAQSFQLVTYNIEDTGEGRSPQLQKLFDTLGQQAPEVSNVHEIT